MNKSKDISALIYILLIVIFFLLGTTPIFSQDKIKNTFKFATFYGAVNGGTSISDVDIYSVTNGLTTTTVETPFDYSVSLGLRKIARFGYENKANKFYDGTEDSWSDAATLGKVKGFEYLFEIDYKRQKGTDYINQHHFLRYVSDDNCGKLLCTKHFTGKVEYLEDGFADVKYFEASERYRYKINNKLSFNTGAVQRLSEPYGYDPLEEWVLENGNLHYTYLAIMEGYIVDVYASEYSDPSGNIVATSSEVWEVVVIPEVLADYTEKKRNELPSQWNHSLVIGFDYYHYTKEFWLHSWGNLLPYHYDSGGLYSYHNYEGSQWLDYSGGLILGYKLNKHLGCFIEGKYNKYWNREWHNFKFGINYVIF
uniref:Uncharacterized protein n=1 Tax=Virus NIOZ-UU157 TaxID=2763269 RepID=A0A7S9XDP5_9VIRU|nr:MAG: hypothetical protein NIOZUU157_00066 [Virus NIOZ-UU157]